MSSIYFPDWSGKAFEKKKVDGKTRFDLDGMIEYIKGHSHTDLYFCPHGFRKPRRKDDDGNAVAPRLYYADLDGADPRKIVPKPSTAWETSPNRFAAVWRVDGPIDWNVNRVWSYIIGADKGGWDATQLLRIPHTINYKDKYDQPVVRVLWDDGERQPVGQIVHAVGIWAKVPPDLLNQIFKEPTGKDDRSDVLWGITNKLKERDFDKDEIFELVVDSGWNHFDKESQLRRDIERLWEKKGDTPRVRQSRVVKPDFFGLHDLEDQKFAPLKWIVPGVLPEGLAIFGGRPKKGKSWMCLDYACAVASGGDAFGEIKCPAGDVLWLPLEDNKRRLKKRTKQYLHGRPWPTRIEVSLQWPRIGEGCEEEIRKWAESAERPRLAIIDTYKRVKPKREKESNYDIDSDDLEGLQKLAGDLRICILIVHHTRKAPADDPFDALLGSTGLMAVVDAAFVLVRERGRNDAKFHSTGRDIEEELDKKLLWNGRFFEICGDNETENEEAKAELFLREMLENGPRKAKEIEKLAAGTHAERTLRRAREKICVTFKKDGVSHWKLK